MLELGEFSYEYHKKIIPIVIQAQPRIRYNSWEIFQK